MSDKSRSEKAESERKKRLGVALRANLKRRKAQERDRRDKTPERTPDDPAIADGGIRERP